MAKRKYVKENNLVKAINTDNLELQKPLVNEYYDINIHNSNMDKIDKGYKQNKNDISDIKNELSKTENTSYTTENGVKEFECKDGYVDNVVIEGQTKILNAENQECEAGANGAKLVSVGQGDKIEVLTRNEGYNIYNGLAEDGDINSSNGTDEVNTSRKRTCYIEIFGKKLYLSQSIARLVFYDSNKSFISCLTNISECDIPVNARFVRFSTITSNIDVQNIAVGYSSNVNSKFYKQDKKQISTTLRSLPNGVKDTIEKRGNKYYKIKRCGEIVLNGSEDWFEVGDIVQANTVQFGFKKGNDVAYKGDSEVFFNCDKIPPTEERNWQEDREFIFINPNDYIISISKTRLSTQDVAGFKTWLSQNPVTVVYELATPIIEELPNFNPQTFSDKTTLLLNSGVIQAEADFEVTNSMGSEIGVLKDMVSSIDGDVIDLHNDISTLEKKLETSKKINFVHSIGIDKNSIYLKYNVKPSQQFNVNDIIENYNSNYFYMFVKPSDGNPIYLLDMCVRNPTVSERGYYIFEIKKDNGKYKIYDNTSIGSLINFKINSITSPSETFTLGSSSYIKVLEILLVPAYVGKAYLASKTTSALSLMEQQISEFETQSIENEKKISILTEENEKLKQEQEQQNEEILVNMLANTEMFEMLLGMIPMTLSKDKTKNNGGNSMIEVYVTLIIKGVKTIEDVPLVIREQVIERLKQLEVPVK